jgi:hypothetical protein
MQDVELRPLVKTPLEWEEKEIDSEPTCCFECGSTKYVTKRKTGEYRCMRCALQHFAAQPRPYVIPLGRRPFEHLMDEE